MDKNTNKEVVFEDISSSSPASVSKAIKQTGEATKYAVRATKNAADVYGNTAFKNIDKGIKFIAFFISITFFLLFLAGAVVVYFFDKTLILVSALLLVAGCVISLIFLYLIYGLGHIISQNKEILRRLR